MLTVTAPVNPALSEQTIKIGIADTSDSIFGSAVFLSSLSASDQGTGGGTSPNPPPPSCHVIPLPGGIFLLVPALAGLGLLRRA